MLGTAAAVPGAWANRGVCRASKTDLWFAVDTTVEKDRRAEYARAVTICRVCPVQQQCLDFALEHREKFGMWGGLLPSDRRRILRNRARAQRQARIEITPVEGVEGTFTISTDG